MPLTLAPAVNVVPTRATRNIAEQMISDAKRTPGADVALDRIGDIDPRQYVALVGILLSRADTLPDLRRLVSAEEAKMATAIRLTADTFGISVEALMGNRERRNFAARAVAMWVCRHLGMTTTAIGRHFERDHSTVVNASRRVDNDPELLATAREIAEPFAKASAA